MINESYIYNLRSIYYTIFLPVGVSGNAEMRMRKKMGLLPIP